MVLQVLKICSKCSNSKDITEFYKKGKSTRSECKKCTNLKNKEYKHKNINLIRKLKKNYHNSENGKKVDKEYSKKYRENLPDHVSSKLKNSHRIYCNKKYNNDMIYRLTVSIRNLVGLSFRKNKLLKNKKTENILGCSIEFFKNFIESKFSDGMNWRNYGSWHLDHIIPISWAKSEEDVYKLNYYTNFKPMWGIENIKKGNRYSG